MKPGDVVRVRPDAEHTPRLLLGRTGRVVEIRKLSGRLWARLTLEDDRESWLPLSRLEAVEREPTR